MLSGLGSGALAYIYPENSQIFPDFSGFDRRQRGRLSRPPSRLAQQGPEAGNAGGVKTGKP